jgi:hypothetical protein
MRDMKCATRYCRLPIYELGLCRACYLLIEAKAIEEAKEPKEYEWTSLCLICSKRTTLKMTERLRNMIVTAGMRCGRCGSGGLELSRAEMGGIGGAWGGRPANKSWRPSTAWKLSR